MRYSFLFGFICIFWFQNCKKSDFQNDCCSNEPLIAAFENAKLYLPNVFTPNGDGLNDFFYPATNSGVRMVKLFRIYSDDFMLFERKEFEPNLPELGWDGSDPSGKRMSGLFGFEILVETFSGNEHAFKGVVCSRSDFPLHCVDHEGNCYYHSSHDGNGGMDQTLPNWENCD